jgi:hypothetical protein
MDLKELRLELLKLTYSHGREAPEAVARAEVLEQYVIPNQAPKAVPAAGTPAKTPPKHLQRGNS